MNLAIASRSIEHCLFRCGFAILVFNALASSAKAISEFSYTIANGNATITGYKGVSTTMEIPSSLGGIPVVGIGEDAFQNLTALTSVTIPDSVTSMGNFVFSGCSGLTSVTLSGSVTNIGESTFYNCTALTSVTIPSSVTSIGGYAFYGCGSLASMTIPSSVTSIGDEAFKNCSALARADFLGSAPTMGADVFGSVAGGFKVYYSYYSNQKGFTKPTWSGYPVGNLNPFTTVASGAGSVIITGYPKTAVGALVIPATLNGKTVVGIGSGAFENCIYLKSLIIPGSISSLGDYSFLNCYALTSVTLPNSIRTLGDYIFANCGSLSDVVIPSGVTSIGRSAFLRCNGLTNVTIPASVTIIGDGAFSECGSLKSAKLPSNLTFIPVNLFGACSALKDVMIPNGVTRIGNSAFIHCSSLTSLIIPRSVSLIESFAFDYCSSLRRVDFIGDAPALQNYVFAGASSSLVLYRSKNAKGFGVAPWNAYGSGFNSPPSPWLSKEIGSGKLAGYSIYKTGTYTETGSGALVTATDKLRFTYQTLSGDGEIVARVSMLQNTASSSRVGVMIRDSLATNSPHVFVGLTGNGAFRVTQRLTKGGKTSTIKSGTGNVSNAWVRLVRKGNKFKFYKSISGDNWALIETTDVTLDENCYVGLVVASGSDNILSTSQFSGVKVKP